MDLILPKVVNHITIDYLITKLNKGYTTFENIDLKNVEFIVPYGMNVLMLILEEVEFTKLIPPKHRVLSYLIRMHFFEHLSNIWDIPNELLLKIKLFDPGENQKNNTLIEMNKIIDFPDIFRIQDIIKKINVILEEQLGYSEEDISMFTNIISELCQNIHRHSQSHGYVSVQRIPFYKEFKWPLKIGITDSGIGFAKTYGMGVSDEQGLLNAVVNNVSSRKKGGLGLKNIKKHIEDFGGELYIRSGTASYYQEGFTKDYIISSSLPYFKGSQVDVTLPNKKID